MSGLTCYVAAAAIWGGLVAQLPDLWRSGRDPSKRSFCAVIFLSGLCFALGAPITMKLLAGLSHTPHVATPVTYGAMTAFSAASLILMIRWQGGSSVKTRTFQVWLCNYLGAIFLQGALFALGDAPVQLPEGLNTYHASTSVIREMTVLYLAAHTTAALTTTVVCWRLSRQVGRWTRASLSLFSVGWLSTSSYCIVKFAAIKTHWLGEGWNNLSAEVSPVLAIGACLTSAGCILPLVGPRVESVIALVRLRPLFRLLAGPDGSRRSVAPLACRKIGDIDLRLTARETAIRDALQRLSGQLDDQVRQRAYREALSAGSKAADAEVIGMAAMVAVAAVSETPPTAGTGTVTMMVGDIDMLVSRHAIGRQGPNHTRALDTGQRSLLNLSRAVRTPIVNNAAVRSRGSTIRKCEASLPDIRAQPGTQHFLPARPKQARPPGFGRGHGRYFER
ncbi:DUF6545 domain-containing protein [Streptomyces sp. NPDC048508]|uniref:DUF6545 domain-containing protein n=1 Tax=Streptomyces sp. NPDC048508 TaxID=3365561 RepID=UPI00371FB701